MKFSVWFSPAFAALLLILHPMGYADDWRSDPEEFQHQVSRQMAEQDLKSAQGFASEQIAKLKRQLADIEKDLESSQLKASAKQTKRKEFRQLSTQYSQWISLEAQLSAWIDTSGPPRPTQVNLDQGNLNTSLGYFGCVDILLNNSRRVNHKGKR